MGSEWTSYDLTNQYTCPRNALLFPCNHKFCASFIAPGPDVQRVLVLKRLSSLPAHRRCPAHPMSPSELDVNRVLRICIEACVVDHHIYVLLFQRFVFLCLIPILSDRGSRLPRVVTKQNFVSLSVRLSSPSCPPHIGALLLHALRLISSYHSTVSSSP